MNWAYWRLWLHCENKKGKAHCYISTVKYIPIEFLIVIHIWPAVFSSLPKYTTTVNIIWKRVKSAQTSKGVRSAHDGLTKPCENTNKRWLGGDSDNSATHNHLHNSNIYIYTHGNVSRHIVFATADLWITESREYWSRQRVLASVHCECTS